MRLAAPIIALLAISTTAVAEPTASVATSTDPTYSVGFRIGGYGFRREGDGSTDSWNQCRMNGLGVFANRAIRGPMFIEAGLDTYFSTHQAAATDLPIDRQSALVSAAIGVRTSFAPWLHGYLQLGGGV